MLKRAVLTVVFAHAFVAGAALAQSSAEYSRASGGEIDALTKQTDRISGSLGFSMSRSALPFLKNYNATLGGTVIKDRMWFFGTAETGSRMWSQPGAMQTGKVNLQLHDTQSLSASAGRATSATMTVPSSFLSLHYTGIISSNSFFTASFSRSAQQQPFLALGQ